MLESPARGVGAAGQQLQLKRLCVYGHQATNPRHVSVLDGIRTSIHVCPEIFWINPSR